MLRNFTVEFGIPASDRKSRARPTTTIRIRNTRWKRTYSNHGLPKIMGAPFETGNHCAGPVAAVKEKCSCRRAAAVLEWVHGQAERAVRHAVGARGGLLAGGAGGPGDPRLGYHRHRRERPGHGDR